LALSVITVFGTLKVSTNTMVSNYRFNRYDCRCSAQAIIRSEVLGAVSQNGVEGEPVRFRVSGVARFPCTRCIHDAAYLSIAVTNAFVKVHRGGPFGMILGHEHLSYAGFGM
jgi:hypothetical protein